MPCIYAPWLQIFCRHSLHRYCFHFHRVTFRDRPCEINVFSVSHQNACFFFPLPPHCLLHLPSPLLVSLTRLCPSSEGEKSRRFIEALVRGGSQEETSLASVVPTHPRPLGGRPRCRGHRPRPPPPPPSPPRPLRFLPDGIAGASRLLPHRERHGWGHRTGASAQEVRFPGHQFSQVAPSNARRQCSDGPPA